MYYIITKRVCWANLLAEREAVPVIARAGVCLSGVGLSAIAERRNKKQVEAKETREKGVCQTKHAQ